MSLKGGINKIIRNIAAVKAKGEFEKVSQSIHIPETFESHLRPRF
jgi:hypothetical protein